MKKCMLCNRLESDDARATCLGCGEATWQQSLEYVPEPSGPAEIVVEAVPQPSEPVAPPKRGPGRPRKMSQ
jgi:hypothetical protein